MKLEMIDHGLDSYIDGGDCIADAAYSSSLYVGSGAFTTPSERLSPSSGHYTQHVFHDALSRQVFPDTDAVYEGAEFLNFDDPILNIAESTSSVRADSAISMSSLELSRPQTKHGRAQSSEQTAAQTRRKAQNRAAQRAFRERKERRVKDLEEQLSIIQNKTTTLQKENERLRILLQRSQTENGVLRATAVRRQSASRAGRDDGYSASIASDSSLDDFSMTTPPNGGMPRLLLPSAAWDLVHSHPLCMDGTVDIGLICERLKQLTRCDPNTGPAFDEQEVKQVIEDVARFSEDLLD
ncbi:hypothetical protein KVT40_007778 [Elsinoe batatas]|uniref:BZIP domain-containing protein n=1 Tax=Elsinoe batatas TaxID=2601811 RepID=A0A8K0KZ80_9PEZI|nr:hypothetical protein KVT40_007778 [Elsinoe batatas]